MANTATPALYVLQVLGTYYEVTAGTVEELRRKGAALRDGKSLGGMTYRLFKRDDSRRSKYRFVRDAVFSHA